MFDINDFKFAIEPEIRTCISAVLTKQTSDFLAYMITMLDQLRISRVEAYTELVTQMFDRQPKTAVNAVRWRLLDDVHPNRSTMRLHGTGQDGKIVGCACYEILPHDITEMATLDKIIAVKLLESVVKETMLAGTHGILDLKVIPAHVWSNIGRQGVRHGLLQHRHAQLRFFREQDVTL